MSLVPSKDD